MNEDIQPWWVTGDEAAYYTDKRGNNMNLKEAHDIASRLRKVIGLEFWEEEAQAVEVLDNRVAELETYVDILRKQKEAADQRADSRRLRIVELESELDQEIGSVAQHIKLLGDRTQELKKAETQRDKLVGIVIIGKVALRRAKAAYWNERNKTNSDINPDWESFALIEYEMASVVENITGKSWEEIETEGAALEKNPKE